MKTEVHEKQQHAVVRAAADERERPLNRSAHHTVFAHLHLEKTAGT